MTTAIMFWLLGLEGVAHSDFKKIAGKIVAAAAMLLACAWTAWAVRCIREWKKEISWEKEHPTK